MNSFESSSTETEQKPREQPVSRTETPVPAFDGKLEEPRPAAPVETGGFASAPFELTYACLLIPRFSDHYLAGDLTAYLEEWLGQICVSYGWRLETLAIRPGYLHWSVAVPPTANPAQIIRLTRRHTSEKIFEEFPRFKQKNMSGDFWAPGYYVGSGTQPLSLEAISNFTQQTRRQQGIY